MAAGIATLDGEDLGAELDERFHKLARALEGRGTKTIYVVASQESWSRELPPLLRMLPNLDALVVVANPSAHASPLSEPPAAAKLMQRARASNVSEAAPMLAGALFEGINPCMTLAAAAGLPTFKYDPAVKEQNFFGMAQQIRACKCAEVDLDTIEYIMLLVVGANLPRPSVWRSDNHDALLKFSASQDGVAR